MVLQLFQTTVGTDPQLAVNNQCGTYYYAKNGLLTVMVTRSVMYVTTPIVDRELTVDIDLPGHPAFFIRLVSQDGEQTYRIDKNMPIRGLVIPKDYQLQGMCPLEG